VVAGSARGDVGTCGAGWSDDDNISPF
jgi:hypothetical protein